MRIINWLLFLFGAAVAVSTVAGVVLNYSPVPFWDQWYGTIDWYLRAEQHWWPEFWSLHNEHRLLFSRLIFWPDVRWFGGVNILSFIANVVVCAALALSTYRAARHRTALPRLYIAGVAMMFCFAWMQAENFTWAFQNQWFAVNLFALLAFHALSLSAERTHATAWWITAMAMAAASSFSMANGCLSWLVLILFGAMLRLSWRFIIVTAALAALLLFAYFANSQGATGSIQHGTLGYAIRHQPIDLIHYTVLYLGSPMYFAFGRSSWALAAGIIVVGATLVAALKIVREGNLPSASLVAYAIFLCGTAFATGGGRLVLGLANVFQPRYATNALLCWMALILFWTVHATRWRAATYASLAIALVAIGVSQPAAFSPDRERLFERLVAGQAIREGVYDHVYLHVLWDHDDYLKNTIEAAKLQHLSILAPDARGYASPPDHIDSTQTCAGYVDGTSPTQQPGMSRAEGWVFDRESGKAPATVVITDMTGKTIGNGVVGKARPDAAAVMKSHDDRLGWVAFYHTTDAIRVFAPVGNNYCRLQ